MRSAIIGTLIKARDRTVVATAAAGAFTKAGTGSEASKAGTALGEAARHRVGVLSIDLEVADWNPSEGPPTVSGRALSVSLFAGGSRAAFFEGHANVAEAVQAALSLRPPPRLCWHAPFHGHILTKILTSSSGAGAMTAAALAEAADDTMDMASWVRPARGGCSLPSLSRLALAAARKDAAETAAAPAKQISIPIPTGAGVGSRGRHAANANCAAVPTASGPPHDLEAKRDMSELFASTEVEEGGGVESDPSLFGLTFGNLQNGPRPPPDAACLASDPTFRSAWLAAVDRDAERVWWTHKWLVAQLCAITWRPDPVIAVQRRGGSLLDGYREITRPLRAACVRVEAAGVPVDARRIAAAVTASRVAIEALKVAEEEEARAVASGRVVGSESMTTVGANFGSVMSGIGLFEADADDCENSSSRSKQNREADLSPTSSIPPPLWRAAAARASAISNLLQRACDSTSQRLFLSVGPCSRLTGGGRALSALPSHISPHLQPFLFPRTPPPGASRVVVAASAARNAIAALIPAAVAAPRGASLILVSLPSALEAIVAAHAARDSSLAAAVVDGWPGLAFALWMRRDAASVVRARDVARACLLGRFPSCSVAGAGAAASAAAADAAAFGSQAASEVYVASRLGASWGGGDGRADATAAVGAFFALAKDVRVSQGKRLADAERFHRSWSLSGRSVGLRITSSREQTTLGGLGFGVNMDWTHRNRRYALGKLLTADIADVSNLAFTRISRACANSEGPLAGFSPILLLGEAGGGAGAILLEGQGAGAARRLTRSFSCCCVRRGCSFRRNSGFAKSGCQLFSKWYARQSRRS